MAIGQPGFTESKYSLYTSAPWPLLLFEREVIAKICSPMALFKSNTLLGDRQGNEDSDNDRVMATKLSTLSRKRSDKVTSDK